MWLLTRVVVGDVFTCVKSARTVKHTYPHRLLGMCSVILTCTVCVRGFNTSFSFTKLWRIYGIYYLVATLESYHCSGDINVTRRVCFSTLHLQKSFQKICLNTFFSTMKWPICSLWIWAEISAAESKPSLSSLSSVPCFLRLFWLLISRYLFQIYCLCVTPLNICCSICECHGIQGCLRTVRLHGDLG